MVTTAPVEEGAGAVVVVGPEPVAGGADDGLVVVVDRPEPPERREVVLVVAVSDEPLVVEVEVEVAASSVRSLPSAGAVVVEVVEGGSTGVVLVVVGSDAGLVVGVASTVVDVVALPSAGAGSPTSAKTGAAGRQTTVTKTVVGAGARRR